MSDCNVWSRHCLTVMCGHDTAWLQCVVTTLPDCNVWSRHCLTAMCGHDTVWLQCVVTTLPDSHVWSWHCLTAMCRMLLKTSLCWCNNPVHSVEQCVASVLWYIVKQPADWPWCTQQRVFHTPALCTREYCPNHLCYWSHDMIWGVWLVEGSCRWLTTLVCCSTAQNPSYQNAAIFAGFHCRPLQHESVSIRNHITQSVVGWGGRLLIVST